MPALDPSLLALDARHLRTLKALLAQHTPHAQVWAYGSRVNGTSHEGSDLDLVLRHRTDLSQKVLGAQTLKEALQASNLPILVDVHQWTDLPEAFCRNIEEGYVEITPCTH